MLLFVFVLQLTRLIHATPSSSSSSSKDTIQSIRNSNNNKYDNNSSLEWGPYKSNLYLGIKPRSLESFQIGLMWANVDTGNFAGFQDMRHTCEQGDDMGAYGWEQADPRTGGRQVIRDVTSGLRLITDFVKLHPFEASDEEIAVKEENEREERKAGNTDWAVRISGVPVDEKGNGREATKTTLLVYVASDKGHLDLQIESDSLRGIEGSAVIRGSAPSLGTFSLTLTPDPSTNRHPRIEHRITEARDLSRISFLGAQIPVDAIWRAKEVLLSLMQPGLQQIQELFGKENLPPPALLYTLPNAKQPGSNMFYLQQTFEGKFQFDLVYSSEYTDVEGEDDDRDADNVKEKVTTAIGKRNVEYHQQFTDRFPLSSSYDTPEYRKFAQILLSNLIGGIGHFSGSSIVDKSDLEEYAEDEEQFWLNRPPPDNQNVREQGPYTLFTAVPSRPFFPRGFYWDEGFHLLTIGEWDNDLALEILKSWIELADEDGWIAREQILGLEARGKVPIEFTTQYPHHANPPTLFFAIDAFMRRLSSQHNHVRRKEYEAFGDQSILSMDNHTQTQETQDSLRSRHLIDGDLAKSYLRTLYPALKRHYDWFRRTQYGDIKSYDRPASSSKEGYRWRGRTPDHCLTSGLDDYPRARPPHPGELHLDLHCWIASMTRTMLALSEFLDEKDDALDFSKILAANVRNLDELHWSAPDSAYCDLSVDDYEESVSVCHLGYVSIFPVLLGLLGPEHPHLGDVLSLIADPDHLWTKYGIRSLSLNDTYYGQNENYWRGPIWININYLLLSSLYRNYIHIPGPHRSLATQIYNELRVNIVETVHEEWQRSGIFWEQYDPETGRGQRTKAFTGWTSLVVNIMAEKY